MKVVRELDLMLLLVNASLRRFPRKMPGPQAEDARRKPRRPVDSPGMSSVPEASDTPRFVSGDVFAGRYRIVARLGVSAMGEVWRADDLVLGTPVALKVIVAPSAELRGHILNEVRLARQITDPAVRRVFDVGEAGDDVFCTMELIDGEDLGTLLKRVGRLPPEKVSDIGQQVLSGLEATHAQGVLHRDLRPANILIDEYGAVCITDFAIGVPGDNWSQHADPDTLPYLAPEQLLPGALFSERTDLYAAGAVLYTLLVGEPPPDSSSAPPPPSQRIGGVDPSLERTILQALSRDPGARPASAAAMRAALQRQPRARGAARLSPWVAGAALAVGIGLLAVVSSRLLPRTPALSDRDSIVLADFANATGDSVFDGTLKVALSVALEQSPFLKVYPDAAVRDTLGLMQRSPDEPVTRALARAIARREQLKALVAGSIASIGSHYVIALEAVDAETGDIMAREQVEVTRKEQVLGALGSVTNSLRKKLGESLATIRRFDAPLPRATTSSLEALHAYALALDEGRVVPRVEAIPHLQRALELDPDFAMAHALLSGVYANTGRSGDAPRYAQRAFELRERVSERERFFISWRYLVDAAQAWDKAHDLATAWTQTYPREAFAFNSLGLASGTLGQHDRAVAAFRQAINLDRRFVPPYGNVAGSLIALNRFDAAAEALKTAAANGISTNGVERVTYTLGFLHDDRAAMDSALAAARGTRDAASAMSWEARGAAASGRFRAAHELYQQAVEEALRDDSRELAAQWTAEDAEASAIAGRCDDSRRESARALGLSRDNFTVERASRAFALCGAEDDALALTRELATRFSLATLTMKLQVPVTTAIAATRRGDWTHALRLLEDAAAFDHAPAAEFWPPYLRGQAYLAMKQGREAIAQFARILDHRGEAPTSPLYPLSLLGIARASTLTDEVDEARVQYERLFDAWSAADTDLAILKEARQEYARIR
jgi:eukaryotic-like serine/threonine-protein kinase